MAIIDSQVHAYEANTPQRPWHTVPNWPEHVTGDEMVAAMDTVGVDGAILISAFSLYQYDASYAVDVQRAHPGRFALVKPVNPDDPTVAEVIAVLRRYYESVGLWDQPGWGLGYELGISLPPDWVGEFYFNVRDTKYLDRVFEPNMVTNFESNFDTGLIDTVVYTPTGTRVLSNVPLELIVAGG